MIHFNRTAEVEYSSEQMYKLVNDVDTYPEFLPWCSHAKVLEQSEEMMLATMEVSAAGIHKSFTTRNILNFPYRIEMQHVDGPFKSLTGIWQFHPLDNGGCRVELDMQFEVEAGLKAALFAMFFQAATDKLVQAFIDRSHSLYGNKAQ